MKRFAAMKGSDKPDFLEKVNAREKMDGLTFNDDGYPIAFRKVQAFESQEHKRFSYRI